MGKSTSRKKLNFSGLRKNFLTGILVLIPLVVILWFMSLIIKGVQGFYTSLPEAWKFQSSPILTQSLILVSAGVTLVLLVSLLGYGSKLYFGQQILDWFRELMQKIPILGTIYSSLDQMLRTFMTGGEKNFNRVVFIEFPRKEIWTIAFVTGANKNPHLPKGFLNVFVPTVPNPTSGFHLIVKESEVKESQMNVEEAFKTLLSFGIAQKEK